VGIRIGSLNNLFVNPSFNVGPSFDPVSWIHPRISISSTQLLTRLAIAWLVSPLAVDANLFGATAGEALFFEPAFAGFAVLGWIGPLAMGLELLTTVRVLTGDGVPAFALLAVIRNLIPENFVVNRTAAMRVGASFVLIPAAVLTVVGNIAPIESVFDGVAAV